MADEAVPQKAHRERQAGRKFDKKKSRNKPQDENLTARQRNPRAFSIQSANKMARKVRRNLDMKEKKHHIPVVDRTPLEPPPIVVAVVGPPKVGKTTLIRCLVKNFTRQNLRTINGPVTVVSGKKRRLTIIECNNDINSMIDLAKVADLVLLLVDASFGFEMETFEFLNIAQVHGFPRIMGVLTHLDMMKDNKALKKTKKRLKHRFWTEVYQGAKLFYLSGMIHGDYQKREVHNLGRFISVMKFRPLVWRNTHSYVIADRMEDLTSPELIRQSPKCDRTVSLYGYVRGVPLKQNTSIHIPGCGDFAVQDVSFLSDPCPLPNKEKKRSLNEKERLIYAPMSGVGGIIYDKDVVYVDLGSHHPHGHNAQGAEDPSNEMVSSLIGTQKTLDTKMAASKMALFTDSKPVTSEEVAMDTNFTMPGEEAVTDGIGRVRRKAIFEDEDDSDDDDEDDDDDDDNDEDEEKEDEVGDENEKTPVKMTMHMKKFSTKKTKLDLQEVAFADSDDDLENDSAKKPHVQDRHSKPSKKGSNKDNKFESPSGSGSEEEDDDDDSDGDYDMEQEEEVGDSESECNDNSANIKHSGRTKQTSESHQNENVKSNTSKREKLKSLFGKKDVESNGDHIHETMEKNLFLGEEFCFTEDGDDEDTREEKRDRSKEEEVEEEEVEEDEVEEEGEEEEEEDENSIQEEEDVEENVKSKDAETDFNSGHLKWKENLAQKAAEAFLRQQSVTPNLRKLVYGNVAEAEISDEDDTKELGGLFTVTKPSKSSKKKLRKGQNDMDCSNFPVEVVRDWTSEEVKYLIADCFVTGKWEESEDAKTLLEQDDELYGDFEDLETGEVHKATPAGEDSESGEEEEEKEEGPEKKKKRWEMTMAEKRLEKKRKLKEMFDADYDNQGGESYFDELKEEMNQQAQLNRTEFEDMDDDVRTQYEGFRAGMYVRVEIAEVPCEFVMNFDPTYPIILGGLLNSEETIGYVQMRLKKHRWHSKILKTRDPLILSIGWRRFQTIPLYSIQDHNGRNRLLKYTPEHMHCQAIIWGPITPQGTGVLAVQSVAGRMPGFRIAATGVILDLDKSVNIVKKLKLTGTPMKIHKNTAFIQGMFNSALEVVKFEGASIRTVSGIRGQIKKPLKSPPGAFRATFEDKILRSDIIFVRTWFQVAVPKLYNPVTSLLLPQDQKGNWTGMRTVGQLRHDNKMSVPRQKDSDYKVVARKPRHFNPLVIPRKLQKTLPFKDRVKQGIKNRPKNRKKDPSLQSLRAVIREPRERKVASLMQELSTLYKERQRQEHHTMVSRVKQHKKKMAALESKRDERQKKAKREVYKLLGQMQKKKNKL